MGNGSLHLALTCGCLWARVRGVGAVYTEIPRSLKFNEVALSLGSRFSFANAETAFLQDIDSDGGQRRKALRLLKFINKECWVPEYGKILTSYHLKVSLRACLGGTICCKGMLGGIIQA